MTTEQEAIAEQVIQKHKDNNGQYNWKEFHLISTAGAPYTVHIIKAKLI